MRQSGFGFTFAAVLLLAGVAVAGITSRDMPVHAVPVPAPAPSAVAGEGTK